MALPAQKAVGDPITSTDHNALILQIVHFREEQASGTPGGTFTSGSFTKRLLNVTALNEVTGASLASAVITLPAGVYNVDGWATGNTVAGHQTRLRQTSGTATTLITGTNEVAPVAAANQSMSRLRGRITLVGSTTLEFQHQCGSTKATNGFGAFLSFGTEVYSEIVFTKVG